MFFKLLFAACSIQETRKIVTSSILNIYVIKYKVSSAKASDSDAFLLLYRLSVFGVLLTVSTLSHVLIYTFLRKCYAR